MRKAAFDKADRWGLGDSRAKTSNSARSRGAATLILAQCQIPPVLVRATPHSIESIHPSRSSASSRTQFERDKLLIGDW
jgi:hypothetical protein